MVISTYKLYEQVDTGISILYLVTISLITISKMQNGQNQSSQSENDRKLQLQAQCISLKIDYFVNIFLSQPFVVSINLDEYILEHGTYDGIYKATDHPFVTFCFPIPIGRSCYSIIVHLEPNKIIISGRCR